MDMHYCDIFGDCYHCPIAFCPYEKYGQDGQDDEALEVLYEDEEPDEEWGDEYD